MGKLLLEHRYGWGPAAVGLILTGAVAAGWYLSREPAILVLVLLGLAISAFGVVSGLSGIRFFEEGAIGFSPFGQKELRYADADTFTLRATAIMAVGIHARTNYRLWLRGHKVKLKCVHDARPGQEGPIEDVKHHISRAMAARLEARLRSDGSVRWADATLTPAAVSFRPKAFVGRGAAVSVPLAETTFTFGGGTFWLGHPEGPRWEVETEAPNFFPGYYLYRGLKGD